MASSVLDQAVTAFFDLTLFKVCLKKYAAADAIIASVIHAVKPSSVSEPAVRSTTPVAAMGIKEARAGKILVFAIFKSFKTHLIPPIPITTAIYRKLSAGEEKVYPTSEPIREGGNAL